jgi:hypothetical protein
MLPFRETRPLCGDLILGNVVMRFLKDSVVPLVNDWGACTGIVHSHDCTEVGCPLVRISTCSIDTGKKYTGPAGAAF